MNMGYFVARVGGCRLTIGLVVGMLYFQEKGLLIYQVKHSFVQRGSPEMDQLRSSSLFVSC